MLYGNLEGRGVCERMDTCIYIYMADSLPFSLETITTLLIGYTPTQNKKFFKKEEKKKMYPLETFLLVP